MSGPLVQDRDGKHSIGITNCDDDGGTLALSFTWRRGDASPICGTLTSGRDGVCLSFGPTVAVSHWPTWLRATTHFGEAGGVARLWLDPEHDVGPETGDGLALLLPGTQARLSVASFLHALAASVAAYFAHPLPEQRQAFASCTGVALALSSDAGDILPTASENANTFWPSPTPILIDDMNVGSPRRHFRLTYRLARIAGWWTEGCSLRVFRSSETFGLEFRSLAGDHLPTQLRAACVEDGLGPLIRFTVDRRGRGTFFEGDPAGADAIQIARAIARQVSRDILMNPLMALQTGFEGARWHHWLAAFPDLLASPSLKPLSTETRC